MPVNKKENKKNAPPEKRDSAIVPTKEEVGKKVLSSDMQKKVGTQRINALSTVGKKKKPK